MRTLVFLAITFLLSFGLSAQCLTPVTPYAIGAIPPYSGSGVFVQNLEPNSQCVEIYWIQGTTPFRATVNMAAYRNVVRTRQSYSTRISSMLVIEFHWQAFAAAQVLYVNNNIALQRFEVSDFNLDDLLNALPNAVVRQGHRR